MIDRRFEDIGPEDLQRLVANQVRESRSLEYKQALPGGSDRERKEFLSDVSSFANAVGGDLLYGVTEVREENRPTGVPQSMDGLVAVNPDADGLRLENILRDGVAPRIAGLRLKWVPGFAQGPILLIRTPQSWSGPHMVTYQELSRFYSRTNAGKYPLDVFELRQAFLASGSISGRAREFRAERIGRLMAREAPLTLASDFLIAVHLVPHAALAIGFDADLQVMLNLARTEPLLLQPLYSTGLTWTFNLDGFLTHSPQHDGRNTAYLLIFRNGALETVNSTLLDTTFANEPRRLPAGVFADHLVEFVDRARRIVHAASIDPPASLFVSLVGVKGIALGVDGRRLFFPRARAFDRDPILFRGVLLTDWDGNARALLKPLLDELWQAAGYDRCFDYDEQGNWAPGGPR